LRLAYLDGLRAVAAAYVVCFHAVPGFAAEQLTGPWRVLRRLFAYGHEAVAVFIVLSGYCLMLPVVQRDPGRLGVDFSRFVRRRAFRILPPYYAALGFSILLLALVPALRQPRTGTIWDDSLPGLDGVAILSHLLVVHNWLPGYNVQINGPLWSVASEWQIYFFFPLLLLPLWRRFGPVAALVASAALGYAPLALVPSRAETAIPWYLMLFCFGMLAAAVGFAPQKYFQNLRERVPWGPICAALWLLCVAWSTGAARVWFNLKPVTDPLIGLSTAALLVHLTKTILEDRSTMTLAIFESKPLVSLGHFSYSLYLTHLPVLALCYLGVRTLGLPAPLQALLLLVSGALASLLVAYGFFSLIERRFLLAR